VGKPGLNGRSSSDLCAPVSFHTNLIPLAFRVSLNSTIVQRAPEGCAVPESRWWRIPIFPKRSSR
jgi:hypothetical protein